MKEKILAWVGIPFDDHSSFLKGTALAPQIIMDEYHSDAYNYYTENLHHIENDPRISFAGILPIVTYDDIYAHYRNLLKIYPKILGLGGDHSITYPILKAYAEVYGNLNVLQFDAHPDLYEELDGNRFSHACPFARAHEDGIINEHIQIGIRAHTKFQQEQALKYQVTQYHMNKYPWPEIDQREKWYISLDLDVLDPAFAPGVSHLEPGGMSSRALLSMIQKLKVDIIGADIVELNPSRDFNGMTAVLAAKLLKELSSKMVTN